MITVANESIDLEEMFCRNIRDAFALRVRGDSLIQDHLCDGDIIVMERREHAHDGEMAVVTFETGESTVRRYYREGDKVRLEPGGRRRGGSKSRRPSVESGMSARKLATPPAAVNSKTAFALEPAPTSLFLDPTASEPASEDAGSDHKSNRGDRIRTCDLLVPNQNQTQPSPPCRDPENAVSDAGGASTEKLGGTSAGLGGGSIRVGKGVVASTDAIPAEWASRLTVDSATGCWVWHSRTSRGYGQTWVGPRNLPAHRVVYERLCGPIPDGLVLDHRCRNRGCVNPDHLEPVTSGENTRRGRCQKLTRSQIELIVARRRAGEPIRKIAPDFGIHPSQICRVMARVKSSPSPRPAPDAARIGGAA